MTFKIGRCLLHHHLHKRGMTPSQLAQELNMSLTQISDYIHNRRKMSLQTAMNISVVVGCSAEELYEWIEERHRK